MFIWSPCSSVIHPSIYLLYVYLLNNYLHRIFLHSSFYSPSIRCLPSECSVSWCLKRYIRYTYVCLGLKRFFPLNLIFVFIFSPYIVQKLKMPPRMKIIIFEFLTLIKYFLFIISILGILVLAHRKIFYRLMDILQGTRTA